MSHTRVSISGLMTSIVMIALGVAALRTPTPLWSGTIFTLTLAALGVSLIGLVNRRGSRRAFWGGFAVLGWGYWLAALSPWMGDAVGPKLVTTEALSMFHDGRWPIAEVSEEQIWREFLAIPDVVGVRKRMNEVDNQISLVKLRNGSAPDPSLRSLIDDKEAMKTEFDHLWFEKYPGLKLRRAALPPFAGMKRMSRAETGTRSQSIGHSLFALLSGVVGGMIAVRFHRTRDEERPCPDDRSNSAPSTT